MAFNSFGGSAGGNAQTGPDLEDIQTEGLGFLTLSGDSKVQLLPTPWPSDQLPPPTSSLMSIASHKGLVAAAGPDAVIVATTESVRKAFEGAESGDGNIKPFQPQLKIPMQRRVSQLSFSADESYLVLSAQDGGGLAVYDVQSLLQGSTQTAFEMSTNGQSLRALVPNPTAEKGELLALVTADGNLMMANLKEQSFVSGPSGQILKNGVSCISWSTKGKQLVAGLGDGTAYQITPEGEGKANIPRPPSTNASDHISSIVWLENHVFLIVHTPSSFSSDMAPTSTFHIVTRQPPPANTFTFQKISDPAGPFGLNRSPPHQFLLRLKDFPPNLQDAIIVASTASTDIGVLTRSKTPLTNDKPADKISGVFTMTEMSDDSHRAQLPMTADLSDTSPIGLALDLSCKEKVRKPIPGDDEIDESPFPLPALMVLNNEGVLASWWIVYNESIRQCAAYPGLAAAGVSQPIQAPPQTALLAFGAPSKPAFGASPFGAAPAFGAPSFATPASGSVFGVAKPTTSAFGAPSLPGPSAGAFGGPSALGQKASPWSTPATSAPQTGGGAVFGSSTFGSTPSALSSTPGFAAPKFGAASTPVLGLGNRASPWATGGSTAPTATFGQSGGLTKPTSVIGSSSTGTTAPATGGFASFASTPSAFGTAGAASTGNIFGPNPASSSFLSPAPATGSIFGGQKVESKPANPFNPGGFVLGSTFKANPSVKNDTTESSNEPKSPFFSGAFSNALGVATSVPDAQTPISAEADMDSDDVPKLPEPPLPDLPKPEPPKLEPPKPETLTPATPAPPKPQTLPAGTPAAQSPFGTLSSSSTATPKPASSAGFNFGQPPKTSGFSFSNLGTTPGPGTPKASEQPAPSLAKTPPSPKLKTEAVLETPKVVDQVPEAPLPPDATSKASYTPGTSPDSSQADGPLPPDSTAKPLPPQFSPPSPVPKHNAGKAISSLYIPPANVPEGLEDVGDDDSDFITESGEGMSREPSEEGSGEDLGKDLSPTSETNPTTGFTPHSSFPPPKQNMFGHGSRPSQTDHQRALFGEIGHSAPVLPPPTRQQGSPRSPSPVRAAMPKHMQHRPDASRSVSAPGYASQILGSQKSGGVIHPGKSLYERTLEEKQAAEKRSAKARERKEAEEKQALIDEDDEEMQRQLAEEITATITLDEFVAHTHYQSGDQKDDIPGQVVTVYRDINSMIDTLGINARALKCFVLGHTALYKDEGRNRDDLESDDEWCLVEVENLSALIEKDLTKDLENSRVRDVANKLEICNNLEKDILRLRAKHEDVKKIVQSRNEPNQVALARAQPLSAEQTAQKNDLQKDFQKFQELLCEAEEGLTLLKAKIVSQATSSGRSNGSAVPTVEAVMRTITKMTSMAEKRSGDIDVLEGQMRKLRFGSTVSNRSREGSPFATPQNNRSSVRGSSTYGLFYTPESARNSNARFQESLMSSVGSYRESPRHKKMSGYTAEEKTQLRTKLARKNEVTNKLKTALGKAKPKVRPMDDDE